MLKLNQKGALDPIVIILLVVVLAMGGYIGWTILNKEKEEAPAETAQVTQQETQTEQQEPVQEDDTIPEGWVEFTSERINASFAYPEDFGSAEVKFYKPNSPGTGERFVLDFSSGPNYLSVQGATSDWAPYTETNIGNKGIAATDAEVESKNSGSYDYITEEFTGKFSTGKYYHYDDKPSDQSGFGYTSEHVYVFDLEAEFAGISIFGYSDGDNLTDEEKQTIREIANSVKTNLD